jgi:hypothetical protein
VTNDEKLSQVNLLWLLSKESVSDHLSGILEKHRSILAREPAADSLLKLRDVHAITMPLVPNELVIQFRQPWAVVRGCWSKCHRSRARLKTRVERRRLTEFFSIDETRTNGFFMVWRRD